MGVESVSEIAWLVTSEDGVAAAYRALYPSVYRSLCRLTAGDARLAEDLLSESFLAMAHAARVGQIRQVTPAWIHLVARRKFLDRCRRSRSEERALARVGLVDETLAAVDIDWSRIDDGTALRASRRLPGLPRAVLILRYVEDLSIADVAETIGRTIPATETLLARSRQAFAALVEEDRRGS
jgi:RNA polymerase sigma-70 factor, ECF subfamily